MPTVNAVEFIGNLVASPRVHTANDQPVTYARLAVTLLNSARQQSGTLWLTLIGREQVGAQLAALAKGERVWVAGAMDLPALSAGTHGGTMVSLRVRVGALELMPRAGAPIAQEGGGTAEAVGVPGAVHLDLPAETAPSTDELPNMEPDAEPTPATAKVKRGRRTKAA
jgi:hypothetical protein